MASPALKAAKAAINKVFRDLGADPIDTYEALQELAEEIERLRDCLRDDPDNGVD